MLKYQKIKKILLYEMKFLVPNYSCLQHPWLGGYRPQIPVLSLSCPQLNLLNPPNTIPGYATAQLRRIVIYFITFSDVCDSQSNMAAISWLSILTFTWRHPSKLLSLKKNKWTVSFGFWRMCSTIPSFGFSSGNIDFYDILVGLGLYLSYRTSYGP